MTSGVKKYDPFYAALKAYDAEYHAEQDGCSLSTVFGDASRAVGDVVAGSSILAVPEAEEAEVGLEAATSGSRSISQEELDQVSAHLSSLDPAPYNDAMIARLQAAVDAGSGISGEDANFVDHELAESAAMNSGADYATAHAAALAQYGVSEMDLYPAEITESDEFAPWFR